MKKTAKDSPFYEVLEQASKKTPEQMKQSLIDAGIIDAEGKLMPHYQQPEKKSVEIEDILVSGKKKKLNSGDKGKRFERQLCKILTDRFNSSFSRTMGSGNRIWQVRSNMPKHAQDTFTGDIVCPEDFAFVLESKGGYDDVDLNYAMCDGHATLDWFFEQADKEGTKTGRKPMVCWRKTRQKWLAFLHTSDLPHLEWPVRLIYNGWSGVPLAELLTLEDKFFFKE
jgi:prepilin-type processing-associated H-X9-DG protein